MSLALMQAGSYGAKPESELDRPLMPIELLETEEEYSDRRLYCSEHQKPNVRSSARLAEETQGMSCRFRRKPV